MWYWKCHMRFQRKCFFFLEKFQFSVFWPCFPLPIHRATGGVLASAHLSCVSETLHRFLQVGPNCLLRLLSCLKASTHLYYAIPQCQYCSPKRLVAWWQERGVPSETSDITLQKPSLRGSPWPSVSWWPAPSSLCLFSRETN